MTSFENTKSEIVGSGLGQAFSLTADSTWADIINAIKGVVNRGAWNGTISSSGGSVTIPPGIHNGSGKVTGPTLATLVGSNVTLASAANLLSGVTAYGKNGVKYTGTDKGYNAGVSSGRNSPAFLMSVFEVAAKANTTYYVPSENYNVANNISIENNTAKIQMAGTYKIICAAIWTGTGSQNMYAQLYRNGSKFADVAINLLTGLTSWYNNNISLSAGDTIQVRTGKTGGSSELIIALLIEKVG